MSGHTSQNPLTRSSRAPQSRRRQLLPALITGLGFMACLALAVERIPHTELGRTISSHLGQLADPASWTP